MKYVRTGVFAFSLFVLFSTWTPLEAQESASNLTFSGDEQAAYRQFRKLATFKGYVFRDLKNHKVVSKLDHGVPDREGNAYLEATGLGSCPTFSNQFQG